MGIAAFSMVVIHWLYPMKFNDSPRQVIAMDMYFYTVLAGITLMRQET